MVGKMRWIGMVILQLEGFPILACLAGLGFYYKNQLHHRIKENPVQLYLLIYSLALLGSFVYATKGGTVDYIFTIGEPAVALFSIYALSELSRKYTFPPISSSIVLVILTVLFILPGIPQNQKTLKGINFEIGADTTANIVATIQTYAKPGELIFAPPYLAFLADRPIAGEFSEQYVWFLKYVNWLRYREGNPNTLPKIEAIGKLMEDRQVKIILLNIDPHRGQQTGQITPFREPVEMYYHPIGQLEMRNETLTIFIPNP
jgi:hypothetical protein